MFITDIIDFCTAMSLQIRGYMHMLILPFYICERHFYEVLYPYRHI